VIVGAAALEGKTVKLTGQATGMEDLLILDPETGKRVGIADAERWLRLLPSAFNGVYIGARLIE